MKKYFKEQTPLSTTLETNPNITKLTMYGKYEQGDDIFMFLEQEIVDEREVNLNLKCTVESEFDELEKDFIFVRMTNTWPVLERKV